jgi:hypothetical protein
LTGDQGVDVLSQDGNEIRIIQCKHTSFAREVDEDCFEELLFAFTGYRSRLFNKTGIRLQPVIVTNGNFLPKTKMAAISSGVEIIGGKELELSLTKSGVTRAEIEAIEQFRCKTMKDVKMMVEAWS